MSVASVSPNGPTPIVQKLDAFARTQADPSGRDNAGESVESAAERAREARRPRGTETPTQRGGRGGALDIEV